MTVNTLPLKVRPKSKLFKKINTMCHGEVFIDSEHSSFGEQARYRINEREDEVNEISHIDEKLSLRKSN